MQKIIVVVGPTASGKSAFAVELARRINGEVVSADSRQVYKGLDIGTGKITRREMKDVPHHLLDITSPTRTFTAHDFARLGRKMIADVVKRGKTPIVAGGTGFYIDALVGRVALSEVPRNTVLRARLKKKSPAQLFTLLARRNPTRAAAIKKRNELNNAHRLIRALEISYEKPVLNQEKPNYDVVWIGIKPDPTELKKNIRKRLVERIKKGMVPEARRLHAAGLSYKRMDGLGLEYRYLALYLNKKITKEEMIEQLSAKIWQYARRQMTYWRRNKNIQWFTPAELQKKKAAIARGF